ncbi:MAG: hypothetical protein V4598_16595 [Bdellovibrionota bacterium]
MKNLLFIPLTFLLTVACNKDDYYGTSLAIEGEDALCAEGKDVASCEALTGCQPAYEDVESAEPVFASCIADPVITPPDAPVPPVVVEEEPTVEEAYKGNCEDLDPKYLLVKNYSGNGQSKRISKVKLCHQTSSSEHAIIVACPALKSHIRHNDYLGACK